jgi:hypothetical protein
MEFSNTDIAKIAGMFTSYHMNAFRIRRHEIFDIEVAPSVVEELDNLRMWMGDQLSDDEKYARGASLHEAISDCKNKLGQLSQEANEAEDPKVQYEQAQEVMEQLRGASYLMELL